MELAEIKTQWCRDGYAIVPNFIGVEEISYLKSICDRILERIQSEDNFKESTNIAYLTETKYFQNDLPSLLKLLEFIASPRIVSILQFISDTMPLFHNTQYFYNPSNSSWDGIWHRDTQFLASDIELEKMRMKQFTGVHFRVAFLDDRLLESPSKDRKAIANNRSANNSGTRIGFVFPDLQFDLRPCPLPAPGQ